MHATIEQKPEVTIGTLSPGQKVLILFCSLLYIGDSENLKFSEGEFPTSSKKREQRGHL